MQKLAPPLFLGTLAAIVLWPNLFRPLWFDEALTILEFVSLPNCADIYFNYAIPNNHIIFNMILQIFLGIFSGTELILRLPSAIFALASVFSIYFLWNKRLGAEAAFFSATALIFSGSFAIYGTAVRGYMLSFLATIWILEFACRYVAGEKYADLLFFALLSFFSVGIIPSNIAAIFASSLIALSLPSPRTKRSMIGSVLVLIGTSAFCLAIFYLPILPKFFKALSLKEGWSSSLSAILHFYSAFLVTSIPLAAIAVFAFFPAAKRKFQPLMLCVCAIVMLIPAFILLVKDPSPFPRTFFPYLPAMLFALATMSSSGFELIRNSLSPSKYRVAMLSIFGAFAFIAWAQFNFREDLSNRLSGGGQDDFFHPYFMDRFFPYNTAKAVSARLGKDGKFFVHRACDYPALIFYAKALEIPNEKILFDPPHGAFQGAGEFSHLLIVARSHSDADLISKRFDLENAELLEDFGTYMLFQAKQRDSDGNIQQ